MQAQTQAQPGTPSGKVAACETTAHIERMGTCHTVKHMGRDVVWRRFGNGPALVLVHGGHGDWRHWIRNIETLAALHTLWVPDLPGFGQSDDLEGAADAADRMDRLVAALHATLDLLVGAHTPVALVGFSFGALVSSRLAARRPVSKLALLGAVGHGGTRRNTDSLLDWRKAAPNLLRDALRQNLGALMLHDPAAVDELAISVYAAQCVATRFRAKAIARAGGLQLALQRYAGPVMLVWGEHDVTATPTEIAPQLAANHSACSWHVIAGAGHWVQYERHNEVSALLVSWCTAEQTPS